MTELYLVADDLTGALDSAAAFCGRYGPTPVFLEATSAVRGSHVAVNLGTRDARTDVAVQATERIVDSMSRARIAFKKIDSLLRGNWAVELACVMKGGAFRTCIFAPAFPGQGRITRGGRQLARSGPDSWSIIPVDPARVLMEWGMRDVSANSNEAAAVKSAASSRGGVLIFDAATDEDLRSIADWGSRQEQPVLWCGSRGLAGALAGRVPPAAVAIRGPLLAVVGSNTPATHAQVAHALANDSLRHVVIGADLEDAETAIGHAVQTTAACLVTFHFPQSVSSADAASRMRRALGVLLPRIPPPGCIAVTGGDTLAAVCLAVGATHLDVDGEFDPGIPHSRLCGGLWDAVDVVSKSGGFGQRTWLYDLVQLSRFTRPT